MTVEAGVMDRIELSELVDIEITCEHRHHQADHDRHEGNATHIQYDGECECPNPGTAFMCARWRAHVSNLAREGRSLYCHDCKTSFPASTVTYTKI